MAAAYNVAVVVVQVVSHKNQSLKATDFYETT